MRALRIALTFLLVTAFAAGLAGCSNRDVAARVNGEIIKRSDLDAQIEALKASYPDMFEGVEGEGRLLEFQQRLLDNMIDSLIMRQAAEERGIEISQSDIDAQIEELRAGFPSDEEFEAALTGANMDLAALENQVRDQLVTEALLASLTEEIEVTDAEIQEYYEANLVQFQEQASVHAAHILFEPADKATAETVLAEIKAGGDFAALAKQHSKDSGSAANGGDLGWPTTPYVPEFAAAAEALAPDEVSDLVETQFGWHIIKCIEKREDREKPLDEVREQARQLVIQQRNNDIYQEFLNEQRKKATIEILVPELSTPAATQNGETETPDGGDSGGGDSE